LQNLKEKVNSPKTVQEMLKISIRKIDFGLVVPGRIMEEDMKIQNMGPESIVLKVVCLCNNPEFADHDEYVYSVRKANNYDYNEKYFILLPP